MAKCGFIERDFENGTATCKGCGKVIDIPLRISTMFADANSSRVVNAAFSELNRYIHKTRVNKKEASKYNQGKQVYKDVVFRFYGRATDKAARFVLFNSNQNVWIPKKHFDETMTLKPGENIDYIMSSWQTKHKIKLAKS